MATSYSLSSLSTAFYVKRPIAYRTATSNSITKADTFVIFRPSVQYLAETKLMGVSLVLDQPELEFPTVYGYIQ